MRALSRNRAAVFLLRWVGLPLALTGAASLFQTPGPLATSDPASEVRALWVLRTSLTSPAAIDAMVASAHASGFNTLLVQVRGRGDAYFRSRLEPRAAALATGPSTFDPLALTIARAGGAGLRVHAWLNVNLIASAHERPADADHVARRRPEWLMVPRELAGELRTIHPSHPEYVDRIMRWTRAQPSGIEGLYASPIHQGAASHTVAVVADLVSRYAVDGIHLDYIRYPNDEFDYSPIATALFRAEITRDLTASDRRRYDERLADDPLAYVDGFPDRWREFRRSRLTALVMRLRTAVKNRRPDAVVSAAVFPDAEQASALRLQDWRTWLDHGLIDVVCPMAYTPDAGAFRTQIEAARQLAGLRPVWAGIGAYRLSSAQTVEHILTARRLGAEGVVLFSYDSLTSGPNGADHLAQIGRAAFNQN